MNDERELLEWAQEMDRCVVHMQRRTLEIANKGLLNIDPGIGQVFDGVPSFEQVVMTLIKLPASANAESRYH